MKIKGVISESKRRGVIRKHIGAACAILAAALAVGSCSKRAAGDIDISSHTRMQFGVQLAGSSTGQWTTNGAAAHSAVSRSELITTSSFYESFGVFGYSSGTSASYNMMNNAEVTENESGKWAPTKVCYWPGSGKVWFYAYAPYDADLSCTFEDGSLALDYSVDSDVESQQDFLVAKSAIFDGDYFSTVPLTFDHALTGIRFVTGSEIREGTIKNIRLKNVYRSGNFSFDDGVWTASDITDFEQTVDKEVDGTSDVAITSDSQTFLMMPQQLPADAAIEIDFEMPNGKQQTFSAPVGSSIWSMGKIITYRIAISGVEMEVEFSIVDWEEVSTGGSSWEIE